MNIVEKTNTTAFIGTVSTDDGVLTFSGGRSNNTNNFAASWEYSVSGSELTITTIYSSIDRMEGTYTKQ